MPFFDPAPIDPDLELGDDIGPGRANRFDDRAKLASAIEKKTGAAPHAELGRFGAALARRFAGPTGSRKSDALPPGFLGAVGAAQIRRGTDPDAVVLKNGPTRDALRDTRQSDAGDGFAPLPKLKQPVGPPLSNRAPNRPEDARALQGKLASLGYVPRVTEKPLFPDSATGQIATPPFFPSGGGKAPDVAGGLQALLDGVAAFQRNKRLKDDRLVNPGGPTERALDAQNEKARKARLDRLETVSREIMDSDAPEYAPIGDRSAADALAGLIVANEVQDQREARLKEKPDSAPAKDGLRKIDRQKKNPGSSEMPGGSERKNDSEEKNTNGLSFDFSDIPPVLEKFDDNHIELLQHKDYWENRATLVEIFAELDGKTDVAGFVRKTIAAERQEVAAQLGKAPDTGAGGLGIVLAGGRGGGRSRPQRPRSIGREITQRGIDLRAERLLKQIRKYDPGFWQYQLRAPGQSSRYTRKDLRFFENKLREYASKASREIRKKPGTGWFSGKLPTVEGRQDWLKGSHRNGGLIPEHIAARLEGKKFRNFDHFRSEFWKAIAADPVARRRFPAEEIQKMRDGKAPRAHETQWIKERKSYEIHHATPIKDGGRVYDMRNMMVLTPRMHDYILPREAHYGPGRKR